MAPGEQNVTAACRPKGQAAGIPFFFSEPCVSSINSGHKKVLVLFFLSSYFLAIKSMTMHCLSVQPMFFRKGRYKCCAARTPV